MREIKIHAAPNKRGRPMDVEGNSDWVFICGTNKFVNLVWQPNPHRMDRIQANT